MNAADPDDLFERGRKLFAGPCEFIWAASKIDGLPPMGPAEIAFAGRSNVGKSSLLNALTGRNALARTSNTPGRTQQLNFFALGIPGQEKLRLVDMPGYGYAKAAIAVKEDWQGLMFEYLRGRPSLQRVFVLLDARIEIKDNDIAALDLLDKAAVLYRLVLTKADAVKPAQLARKQAEVEALARKHAAALTDILTTSSETGLGIDALRADLAGLALPVS